MIRKVGHLTVERGQATRSVTDAGRITGALQAGLSVLVFPEGTFVRAPGILPFRLGGFKAAVDTGRPVIPVTIRGAREILPAYAWLPEPGPITVAVSAPIMPEEDGWRAMVRLRDRTRAEIIRRSGEPAVDRYLPTPDRNGRSIMTNGRSTDHVLLTTLGQNWWMVGARGRSPACSGSRSCSGRTCPLNLLVATFGVYAVLDGAWAIASALWVSRISFAMWPVLFEGVVSLGVGWLALGWPLVPRDAVRAIAAWGLLTGVLELVAAARLPRRECRVLAAADRGRVLPLPGRCSS